MSNLPKRQEYTLMQHRGQRQ